MVRHGRAVTTEGEGICTRHWTDVIHFGAQDGFELGVHAQQGQVVQFLGPLSSVRSDSTKICTRLLYSTEEEGMVQGLETIQTRVEKRQRRSPTRRGTGEEFQTV